VRIIRNCGDLTGIIHTARDFDKGQRLVGVPPSGGAFGFVEANRAA
jgi:hypothetical protein